MKPITRRVRSVDDSMAFVELMWDDADRRFATDALADGVDPEEIDAALAQSRAERAGEMARHRAELTAWLADCRAGRA